MEHDTVPCLTLAPPIEVLLVDDQRAILSGATALIQSEGSSMRVIGQATNGRQALDLARSAQPNVLILDVDLGGEDGLALIPLLLRGCNARIVVFTCLSDAEAQHRAIHLGTSDLFLKLKATLLAAILGATEESGGSDNCHDRRG